MNRLLKTSSLIVVVMLGISFKATLQLTKCNFIVIGDSLIEKNKLTGNTNPSCEIKWLTD